MLFMLQALIFWLKTHGIDIEETLVTPATRVSQSAAATSTTTSSTPPRHQHRMAARQSLYQPE